jgi:hypothetical protein
MITDKKRQAIRAARKADAGRCLTARAATRPGLSRFASSCQHRIAIAGDDL